MTITVTPTVEASAVPPRIRLNVTASAGETSTTITRLNPDGSLGTVRTTDGAPLPISGGVALVYDYEAPYSVPVSYSSLESPATSSGQVTLGVGQVWLVHPGVPSLSMPVDFRAGSLDEETWDVNQGSHWPMGRDTPVVQTDGARRAPASSVTVAIDSAADLAALRAVTADAAVLLLNIPADMGLQFDTCYVAIGAIKNKRVTDIGGDPYRAVELPIQVTDAPVGGTQAQRTYVDVLAGFATYAAVSAKYPTYLALLAGP